jgi:phage gpG-like protein
MSDSISIRLTDQSKELIAQFPLRADMALTAMAKELDRQNELTIAYAQENKLSAPSATTLGVRTGLLRRSLRRNDAVVSADTITGAIGTNVKYAAVHEYGFDGDVEVSAFTRRVRSRDVRVKRKLTAFGVAYVRAFTRHMRMPARPFISSSIAERLDAYCTGLSNAAVAALGGAA